MAENSSHNTVNPFQEDFNSYKEFTNVQLLLINRKIDKYMDSVTQVLRPRNQRRQQEDEKPFGDKGKGRSRVSVRDFADKGLLRPPPGVTLRRLIPKGQDSEEYDGEYVEDEDEGSFEENDDDLRHLKLVFPAFAEGDEAVEWVRDCEEYFSIYG